jgi:hypothetical protein
MAVPKDRELTEVMILVERQRSLEHERSMLEESLARCNEDLRKVQEHDLPLAMETLMLDQLKLTDGTHVTIKRDVRASIAKVNLTKAIKWLDDHKFGDLVKSDVTAKFTRQDRKKAQVLANQCAKKGYAVTLKEHVHPMTLSAFVREQMEQGAELPMDLFGVVEISKATIVSPVKARKKKNV